MVSAGLPAGIADAYWELRIKPWDVAAGTLLVTEAGGTITTMDGKAGPCCCLPCCSADVQRSANSCCISGLTFLAMSCRLGMRVYGLRLNSEGDIASHCSALRSPGLHAPLG